MVSPAVINQIVPRTIALIYFWAAPSGEIGKYNLDCLPFSPCYFSLCEKGV